MRSFAFSFSEALRNGLRRDDKVASGARYLKSCYGWKPTAEGLEGPQEVAFPVEGHTQTDYTQFVDGIQPYLFDYSDSAAKLYPISSAYTKGSDQLSSGTLPNAYTDTGSITIRATNNQAFDCIQSDIYVLLTNGDSFLIKHDGLYTSWAAIDHETNKIPSSICMVGKQLIVGGFEGNATFWEDSSYPGLRLWVAARQWREGFAETYIQRCIFTGRENSLEGNYPFVPELIALTGKGFSSNQEMVEDLLRSGAMGFVMIPWEGKVLRTKALGDKCIVYGDKGIGIYFPQDKVIVQLARIGLASRDSIGGDEREHVFVDVDGYLWVLNAEMQLERLGFQEYMEASPRISFNPLLREYYLTGTSCYGLTEQKKLYQSYYKPTSLITSYGDLYGTGEDESSATYYFETHESAFRHRGQKRVCAMELQQLNCSSMLGTINARVGSTSYSLSAIRFNTEDVGWGFCVGTDFSFKVAGTSGESGTIDDLQIKWQRGEGRSVRGLMVGENDE